MRRPDSSDDRHVMTKHHIIYPTEEEVNFSYGQRIGLELSTKEKEANVKVLNNCIEKYSAHPLKENSGLLRPLFHIEELFP